MKCDFCQRDEALPFVCNYCGGAYCGDHRLPEAHQCKGDLSQRRVTFVPAAGTSTTQGYSGTFSAPQIPEKGPVSSVREVRDILIAWGALGAAFTLANLGVFNRSAVGVTFFDLIILFFFAVVTVGVGFVLHELSHKFAARRYGYWAEFRVWPFGLIFALITSIFGIIFAAPGATYISGTDITKERNGKISLAGPLTNVGVAFLFLIVSLSPDELLRLLGRQGVYINLFLALFNMIPIFPPIDGAKVFAWRKEVWLAVFLPLAAAFLYVLRLWG